MPLPLGHLHAAPAGAQARPGPAQRPEAAWRRAAGPTEVKPPAGLRSGALTDTGRRRNHNEDSFAVDTALGLAVVADGMGGYKAGEVASAMAVGAVTQALREDLRGLEDGDRVEPASGLRRASLLLRQAVLDANHLIYRTAQEHSECQGMGTTVVALLVYADRVSIAHVGDSRVYRLRGERLSQLTSDHSLVQELVDRGFFSPQEAVENTPRNLVTRALGIEAHVVVDIQEEEIGEGDLFLLCSDGLNDMVSDEEMLLTLRKYGDNLDQACAGLVHLANERGGKDNVTVVLLAAAGPASQQAAGTLGRLLGRG